MEGRWVHDLPHGEVRVSVVVVGGRQRQGGVEGGRNAGSGIGWVRVGLTGGHDKAGETNKVQAWKVESV